MRGRWWGRGAAAAALGIAAAMLAAQPAAAQFACMTTTSDVTCTNTGTAVAAFVNPATGANQNATTTNAGSAAGFTSVTTAGGNAAAANNASNSGGDIVAVTQAGGNATASNSSSSNNGGNGIIALTQAGGNATASNSGSNSAGGNGITVQTTTTGSATATNSGSNSGGTNGIVVQTTIGDAVAINSGSNAGGGGFAIVAFSGVSGNVTVINSGTSTSVSGIFGQTTTGGNVTVLNSGSNTSFSGIVASTIGGGDVTVTNSGANISVNGIVAATFLGGNATVINTGTNTGGITVSAAGGNAIVLNAGTTSGTVAMQSTDGSEILTNSGAISNFGGTAIVFAGGPDTLNLQAGSTITGAIDLVGANDTVNFQSGNHNLTFNTLAGARVNGPDPFVVAGNRAAALDPTPFALADATLMDFTRAVADLLDGLGPAAAPGAAGAAANGPPAFAAASPAGAALLAPAPWLGYADDQAMVFKAPTLTTRDGRAAWARGFAGARTQDAQDGMLGARTAFDGGAVGFDLVARADLRLGVFAGGGESRLTLDGNVGATGTDTAFGGLYGRWSFASFGRRAFLDFALHGGGATNATSRTVNNNTIPGGIEIATANYASAYISPQLGYGLDLPLWAQYTLTPSLRARYVAGFLGGYSEAGTTAPLTVARRTIQDFEERGELALTRAQPLGGDLLLTRVHAGALAVERAGDSTVDATLLGINLPFATPGRARVAGVVGGAGFEWRTREGASFFGAGEAIGFSDQSTVWSARGGLRVAF